MQLVSPDMKQTIQDEFFNNLFVFLLDCLAGQFSV